MQNEKHWSKWKENSCYEIDKKININEDKKNKDEIDKNINKEDINTKIK